jgi:hypothetical protein
MEILKSKQPALFMYIQNRKKIHKERYGNRKN